ncbi:MAG: FAD-binding protein [Chitinophagales bacterium]
MKRIEASVLVIGGGGAGLRAALAAAAYLEREGRLDPARPVVLATKGELGRSGVTALACSDRMAFHATLPYTAPGTPDNWLHHAADIYRIGGYVSDADLAMILAKGSGEAAEYLAGLGVPFARTADGRFDQFVTDGSEYPRAMYTGPYTANHIEAALVEALGRSPVRVLEETMLVDVVKDGQGRVTGARLLTGSPRRGEEQVFCATSAVVLATGGAGKAFAVNVFPAGQTGDGFAAAYRAGAELVNLEFIQIGLCSVRTKLACSGSIMRAVPRLVNDAGEEFLGRYFPGDLTPAELGALVFRKGATWPVSYEHPTHRLDVAVFQEILAGRKVYLDFSRNPEGFDFAALPGEIKERYASERAAAAVRAGLECVPEADAPAPGTPLARLQEINPPVIAWFKERGIDLVAGDLLELAPAIQHFQGGVKIGPDGQTSVPGLFAAGETAGGQHGANRPGGNALMDAQVFGRVAGEAAARAALAHPVSGETVPAEAGPWSAGLVEDGPSAYEVRRRIQEIAYRSAGVIRTEEGLADGLAALAEVARQGVRPDEHGLAYALETVNLLLVAEMVLKACAARPESRGPHLYFEEVAPRAVPCPRQDPAYQVYLVVSERDGRMTVSPATPVGWDEALESLNHSRS